MEMVFGAPIEGVTERGVELGACPLQQLLQIHIAVNRLQEPAVRLPQAAEETVGVGVDGDPACEQQIYFAAPRQLVEFRELRLQNLQLDAQGLHLLHNVTAES